MNEIAVTKIDLGSLFKSAYLAFACVLVPLTAALGLYAMRGGAGVYQNGQPAHGVTALITSLMIGLLFPAIFAALLILGVAILRPLGSRAPRLRIKTAGRTTETG